MKNFAKYIGGALQMHISQSPSCKLGEAGVKKTIENILDLLKTYQNLDKSKLQQMQSDLAVHKALIANDISITEDQKNQMNSSIDKINTSISCLINSTSQRTESTCDISDIEQIVAIESDKILASDDINCPCSKPTSIGQEGDEIIGSGSLETYPFGVLKIVPCKKKWIYHSSYAGSKYNSGWYHSSTYNEIETFVKNKIAPIIFVHGTWSDPSTFSNDFKNNIYSNLKLNIPLHNAIADFKWSGGNTVEDRNNSAIQMSSILNSNLSKKILNNLGFDRKIFIIAHSHGGNVAKKVKNILENTDPIWEVNLINIETPQRSDFQINSNFGKVLNFWSNSDLVQWAGSMIDSDRNIPNPGPQGVRIDPKADANIQLVNLALLPNQTFIPDLFNWVKNTLGHSLQNDDWYKSQIYFHISKTFK